MSDKKQELLTLREHQSSPQMFSAIRVVHLFSVGFFCLHPVSCVPGLSFLDFPSGSLTFVPSNRILTSTTVHSEKAISCFTFSCDNDCPCLVPDLLSDLYICTMLAR